MKIISNIKTIVLATLIATLGVGCSLDENLYGTYETEDFIDSDSDVDYVLNGVYSTLLKFQSIKSCALSMLMYGSDDLCSTKISTGFSAGLFLSRGYNSENTYVTNGWSSFFEVVSRSNAAIYSLEASKDLLSERVYSNAIGEAYFLRGYAYYNLVRLFGGVPIFDTALTGDDDFYRSRSSVEEVYELIFEDFKRASVNCYLYSEQPSNRAGGATKGAAQAMLASAYLTYASYCEMYDTQESDINSYYENAIIYADSVINSNEYELVDDYADLFDVDNESLAYKEVIYAVQHTRDATGTGATSKGNELPYYTQPTTRYNVTGNSSNNGNGNAAINVQPWFYDMYQQDDYGDGDSTGSCSERDYRTDVSFLTEWESTVVNDATGEKTTTKYITFPQIVDEDAIYAQYDALSRGQLPYLNKYVDGKGYDSRNHENNFYVMRLSQVYLIKAEALNELDRTSEAYAPFNMLRERARKSDGNSRTYPLDLAQGLTKEEFRLAVFDERGIEFVGEGWRWFDAVRTRYMDTKTSMLEWRLDTYYPEYEAAYPSKWKAPYWNSTSGVWNGRFQLLTITDWDERYLLYPIPSSEILSNSNFGEQNAGW